MNKDSLIDEQYHQTESQQTNTEQGGPAELGGGLPCKMELQISAFTFFSGIIFCLAGLIAGRVLGWKNMEEIYPLAIGVACLLFGFWRLTTRWDLSRSPELFVMVDRSPSIRIPLALGLCLVYAAFALLCVGVAFQLPSIAGESLWKRLWTHVSRLEMALMFTDILLLGFYVLIALACLFPFVRAAFRALRVVLGLRPSRTLRSIEWFARRHQG